MTIPIIFGASCAGIWLLLFIACDDDLRLWLLMRRENRQAKAMIAYLAQVEAEASYDMDQRKADVLDQMQFAARQEFESGWLFTR